MIIEREIENRRRVSIFLIRQLDDTLAAPSAIIPMKFSLEQCGLCLG